MSPSTSEVRLKSENQLIANSCAARRTCFNKIFECFISNVMDNAYTNVDHHRFTQYGRCAMIASMQSGVIEWAVVEPTMMALMPIELLLSALRQMIFRFTLSFHMRSISYHLWLTRRSRGVSNVSFDFGKMILIVNFVHYLFDQSTFLSNGIEKSHTFLSDQGIKIEISENIIFFAILVCK